MNNLLTDDDGRVLPLRMHPETWEDLKRALGMARTSGLPWSNIQVITNKWLPKGEIIQMRLPEDDLGGTDVE